MGKDAFYSEENRVYLPEIAMRLARREAEIELALLDPDEVGSDAKKAVLTGISLLGLDCEHGPMISEIAFWVQLGVICVYSRENGESAGKDIDVSVNPEKWWASKSDTARIIAVTAESIEMAVRGSNEGAVRGSDGRYALEDAAKLIAGTLECYDIVLARLEAAALGGDLPVYIPGERMRYKYAKDEHVRWFYEEAYWDDLNAWLEANEPRITHRFVAPHPGVTPRDGQTNITSTQGAVNSLLVESMQQAPDLDVKDWELCPPNRMNTLQVMIYRVLKAAHRMGRTKPRAREVMSEIADEKPSDFIQIIGGEIEYYDSQGNSKTANAEAIQKRIDRMTAPLPGSC